MLRISSIFLLLASLLLNGCTNKAAKYKPCVKKQTGRYHLSQDSAPAKDHIPNDILHIPNATPKNEPISKYGNPKSYVVFNKRYHVLKSSSGYKSRGLASWYGSKFHGYRTSSGELYDMYAMTAAHKTLPLPTYIEVKNLDNGKKVIVKVNDRGPFHGSRILDLSYAAAAKLDIVRKGTGRIEITAINPRNFSRQRLLAKNNHTNKRNTPPNKTPTNFGFNKGKQRQQTVASNPSI